MADVDQAFAALEAGEVEAVVYDAPILQYWATGAGRGIGHVVGPVFADEDSGIALPQDRPLEELIIRAIIGLSEDGTPAEITRRWFGDEA